MIDRTFTDNKGISWTRVSKRRARRLFAAGHVIEMSPVNMNPCNVWCTYYCIGRGLKYYEGTTFDAEASAFEYYNCNSECGKYAAYYVRTEVLE